MNTALLFTSDPAHFLCLPATRPCSSSCFKRSPELLWAWHVNFQQQAPSHCHQLLTPSQQLAHSSLYPVLTEEIPPQPYACRDQARACTQAWGFRPAARLAAGIISAQNLKGKV